MTSFMTRFTPPISASYQFRIQIGQEDHASLWFDENQDGNFSVEEAICRSDPTNSQSELLEGKSYNMMLSHGVPSGVTTTKLTVEVKSDDNSFSN